MQHEKRFKLKPHYLWIGGIFVIGGLITAISWPRESVTHALSSPGDEWRTMEDITYMQQMTAKICANSPTWPAEGSTKTLIDKRDDKSYTIAKISNQVGGGANCWMTQNLALDLEKYWNSSTMVTTLTDVPSDTYFNGIGATKRNDKFTQSGTNYQLIEYTNETPSGGNASYGFYYTWCAATAGCKNGSNVGASLTSGDAQASICPTGWKLPSGNENGEWYNLLKNLNKSTVAAAPYSIPAAGYVDSSGLKYAGSRGTYWSRTASGAVSAYYLNFDSSAFYPGTGGNNRYLGHSVRCVADTVNPDPYPGPNQNSTTANFSITVNEAITLAEVSFSNSDNTSDTISAIPGQLATGKINVNVGSNVSYKIKMSSESPALSSSNTEDNPNVIPAITRPMSADDLKSNFGWGIMKKNSDNSTNDTVYTGLSKDGDTFYTSDTPAGASRTTQFDVGVGVPPTLPADVYSTEVTVTAIATE